MPHKIIVLSDGTGNSAAKVWRANVWRVFEYLDLTGPDQVAKYDDGVGSSAFKSLAILGGAVGWSLKRNAPIYTSSSAATTGLKPEARETAGSQITHLGSAVALLPSEFWWGSSLSRG